MKTFGCGTIVGLLVFMLTLGVALGETSEDNWPNWRGPTATGVAAKGNPPITWSDTENIKWKMEVPGNSSSTPVVWGEKLIFQTAIETEKETAMLLPETPEPQRTTRPGGRGGFGGASKPTSPYKFDVVCVNRNTGKITWQTTVCEALPHEGSHRDHSFSSYSPVTDGERIWVSFGSRGIYCLDMVGKLIWRNDLIQMSTRASFGEGSSPAVVGDAVVVLADHEGDSMIFAFQKMTGRLLWKRERDERTSWSTPVGVMAGDKLQVITNATNMVRAYDIETGEIIWQCSGQTDNVIPSPVIGHGMVYCMSGYRGNAVMAIKLGKTGDLTGTDAVVWEKTKGTPYVPSPLLYGDKLYYCFGNNATISCVNAKTGESYYELQKLDGPKGVYASPTGAGGHVYLVGRNGVTSVLKNSDKLEVVATNTLSDAIDASPIVVGDNLYLKGKKNLYCIAK